MARIRSIHPSLFTDEAYMGLSLAAKAAWPGIWTEADDNGVFEWKPLTLKARLLPTENLDMEEVLVGYASAGLVLQFEVEGKKYGAIKGFCRWQRPKSPTHKHPLPESAALFVAHSARASEEVGQSFGGPSPIAPQRKEEGGRREEVKKDSRVPWALDIFNTAASRQGWPKPTKLTPERQRRIQLILDEHGEGGFQAAVTRAEASTFINEGGAWWSLDWFLKPANFRKLIEGNYDNRPGTGPPQKAGGWN